MRMRRTKTRTKVGKNTCEPLHNKMKRYLATLAIFSMIMQPISGFASKIEGGGAFAPGIAPNDNGSYDITPIHFKDGNAFNSFAWFELSQDDIANLNMKDASKLFNFVNSQIKISGTVNTLQNGKIGGNVYFLSKDGMVVNSTGSINTGSLTMIQTNDVMMNKVFGQGAKATEALKLELSEDIVKGVVPIGDGEIIIKGRINTTNNINALGAAIKLEGAKLYTGIVDFSDVVNLSDLPEGTKISNLQIDTNGGKITLQAGSREHKEANITIEKDSLLNAKNNVTISAEAHAEGIDKSKATILLDESSRIQSGKDVDIRAESLGSDSNVTINGSILAGAFGQLDIRIGGDGSELYDGVNPRLEVRDFITGQWEDCDYSELGLIIEDGVIYLPDLKAETGNISITSSSLTGSGTLKSREGTRIIVDNYTNADIQFNSVILDGNGSGEVTWNGQGPNNNGIIGSSGSSINVLSDFDFGSDDRKGIYLSNNWRKIYHDNDGPDMDVIGDLKNKNGLIKIINKSGNVSVGDIEAKDINIEILHGNYDQIATTDLTLSKDSYIVASGDINIRANNITNDGIIQSGFAKYEVIDDGGWDRKDGNGLTDEATVKYNQYRLNEGGIFKIENDEKDQKDQDGTYKYVVQAYYNPAGHAFIEDIVSHGGNVAIDGNLSGTGKVVALDGMADVTIKNNVRALFKLNRIEVENIDGNVTVNNNEEQIKYIRNDASTIDVTASGDIELLNNIIGDRRNNAESEINIQSKNGSIAQIDGDIVSDKLMLSANNRIHFNKIGVGSLLSMIGNELSLDYAWQLPNRSNMVKVKLKSVGDITPINNVNFKYLDIANGVILERLWANNAFVHVQAEKFYIPQVKITEEGNFSNKHAKAKIYGSGPRRDPDMDFMVWNDRRWFSPRIDFYFLGGKVVDSNALLFYNRDYYRIFKGMLQSYINERFDALSTRDSYQDRRVVDDVVIDLSDEGVQKEEE